MQRTIWEWLGIEKTTDKSRIKKAYAEQVKRYHPEEFPQEAQQLRKAYKDAMALASAAQAAPRWVEDVGASGGSFVVKDSGNNSAEHSSADLQPEAESKYAYKKSAPPGAEPEPKPESEYVYRKSAPPGMQPEPKSELEYAYKKSAPPSAEPVPGPESEYAYKKSAPPGAEPEPRPEYIYKKSAPPGMQPGPEPESEYVYKKSALPGGRFRPELESGYVHKMSESPGMQPGYSFAGSELPHAVAMRVADLKKRMEEIYGTDQRNSAEKWGQAFAEYPDPKDLRDVRAVWEIFAGIEPMSRLNGSVWEILQKELFRYQKETASWKLLQERFDTVRRSYGALAKTSAGTPPKKTNLTEFFVIFIIMVVLLISVSKISNWLEERKRQQRLLEIQQQISEQMQRENPAMPFSRNALQALYTKEFPCKLDLNQDQMQDHLYFDPQEGLFMVELYDASTDTYNLYGSVDQYLEENPEADAIKELYYFTNGGT